MSKVFIGYDDREQAAYHVAANTITRHSRDQVDIKALKHRELRKQGIFRRPWLIESDTGLYRDLIDNKPFATQFSHTRFLVPYLADFKGWALFMDCDMIFTCDIRELFALKDDKYACMVVKHNHRPKDGNKMDDQPQTQYYRKNWSSFVLWNCGHPKNKFLSPARVNALTGTELHTFSWLDDFDIGHLGFEWNWIENCSPVVKPIPKVIHYTEGGPWFDDYQDVLYGDLWIQEYERWQRNNSNKVTSVLSVKYDLPI